jgi:hypothetical protein
MGKFVKKSSVFALIVAAAFALSGCSGDVGEVKSIMIDGSLELGKLMDNYKGFSETSWEAEEDAQGRRFVTFTGHFDEDYLVEQAKKNVYDFQAEEESFIDAIKDVEGVVTIKFRYHPELQSIEVDSQRRNSPGVNTTSPVSGTTRCGRSSTTPTSTSTSKGSTTK